MERRIKIYYLADQYGVPFYVGATLQTLRARLNSAGYTTPKHCGFYQKSINLIEEADLSDAAWLEQYWIAQFKAWGYTLTNKMKANYPVAHMKYSIDLLKNGTYK